MSGPDERARTANLPLFGKLTLKPGLPLPRRAMNPFKGTLRFDFPFRIQLWLLVYAESNYSPLVRLSLPFPDLPPPAWTRSELLRFFDASFCENSSIRFLSTKEI